MADRPVLMPTEVSQRVGFFDRFAGVAAMIASRAVFFTFCVLLIVVWAPSVFLIGSIDTWQLIINTATTIITFLMVALLQNSQTRSDQAVQHKLNALADGLADLMAHFVDGDEESNLEHDLSELRQAVGLEEHESTSGNSARRGARSSAAAGKRSSPSSGGRRGGKGSPRPRRGGAPRTRGGSHQR
jgi:low affinity Fe/Cu permease